MTTHIADTRGRTAITAVFLSMACAFGAGTAVAEPTAAPTDKLAAAEAEFQLNSYTTAVQAAPSIAKSDDGFVVVWDSSGSFFGDTDDKSIQGQRLDEEGQPVSSEFQVNSTTSGSQRQARVAAWSDGRFVAAWRDGSFSLRARLFASDGTPVDDDFVVATNTAYMSRPDVAVRDDDFLVVYTEPGDGDDKGISGRLFGSDGTPLGAVLQINAYTTGVQSNPEIGRDLDQNFVVVWDSLGSFGDDSDDSSIQLRRVGTDGAPSGTDFQVNALTSGYSSQPRIDFADEGHFLIAWAASDSPGDDLDLSTLARRFDSAGAAVGTEFQVNAYTDDLQYPSDVHSTPDGGFIVAWSGYAAGSSDSQGFAAVVHRFDSGGASVGGDLVVNTLTTLYQYGPNLAQNARGDFLVVWDSDVSAGTDDSSTSIQARFFSAEADVAVTVDNGADTVTPGTQVVYTVEVTNAGPDVGTGVELTDTLSSDLTCTWTSVASGGATGNTAIGSGDLAETLDLPPAAGVVYTLDCDVASGATGGLLHTAEVTVDQVDGDASNDTASDLDALVPSTDLGLTLAASSPQVGPGDEVELTATVTQDGPSASSGSTVFAALPAELTFASSSDCTLGFGFVQCTVPALDPGETADVAFRVEVDPGLPLGETVDLTAVVLADDDDPDAGNDDDSVQLTVVEPTIFADGFETGDVDSWTSSVP